MMNLFFRSFFASVFLVLFASQGFSQVKVKVEGLRGDAKYMSLMEGLYKLEIEQDSVVSLISKSKSTFSSLTESQVIDATNDILELEMVLFEIRSKLGNVRNVSSIIEQEYIIASLESGVIDSPEDDMLKENNTDIDILKTDRIKNEIPSDIYKLILTGDSVKSNIDRDFRFLMDKVSVLSEILSKYSKEGDVIMGDSLILLFDEIYRDIKMTDISATKRWSLIYDTQIDQYNRLLDKFNAPSSVVDRLNEASRKVRNEEANIDVKFIAPNISKYSRQRSLIMQYEMAIAGLLNLTAASTSLTKVMSDVDLTYYDVEKLSLPMQDMIEYIPLKRATASAHTSKNLPSELIIPTKGEVYKVELGTFSKKLTNFNALSRVSPAEYMKLHSGKYRYWAGSYKSQEEALAASKMVNKYGLRSKVTSWQDGVNSADSTLNVGQFKISIPFYTTTIIDIVANNAPGKEITKSEDEEGGVSYCVTLFYTRGEAEKLAAMLGEGAKVVMVR